MAKQVHRIHLSAKCSDLCWMSLEDEKGERIAEGDGYVPDFMPGDHYGDYITLEIDPKTGVITNWRVPSDTQMIKDVEGMS